jgi:FkbM family methyltransferase
MSTVVLKTKYAFHLLLWLLEPEVVLDIGSMDGADSRRFRQLLPNSHIVAFEGNPDNYQAMLADQRLEDAGVRVLNMLVADGEGERSFYVQRSASGERPDNRGTSSFTPREAAGMRSEEIRISAVRGDLFLQREYPGHGRVAAWIDVEGHACSVLEGMRAAAGRIDLVHVEVETRELWPGQKLEKDVLALADSLGLVEIARGAGEAQRDLVLMSNACLARRRLAVGALLGLARAAGPLTAGLMRHGTRLKAKMLPGGRPA